MPTISIRGMEMPASPIRKLAPLADAAKQRGIHVFHLNIGQPDLPTPEVAIEAIRNIDRKVLEYSPSAARAGRAAPRRRANSRAGGRCAQAPRARRAHFSRAWRACWS